jgi:hypothetical protein
MKHEFSIGGGASPNLNALFRIIDELRLPPLKEMQLTETSESVPFDAAAAKAFFEKQKNALLTLFDAGGLFEMLVGKGKDGNTLLCWLDESLFDFLKQRGYKDFLSNLTNLKPSFYRASIDVPSYYREQFRNSIPVSTGAFGAVGWLHLVSPTVYEPFFTREDLLNAPAHEVLEWDDGTIQITTYKDFLPYDRPEALEAIRRLSLYLNEKRLDGPRMIPELAS